MIDRLTVAYVSLSFRWPCAPYQGFSFRMSPACLPPGPFPLVDAPQNVWRVTCSCCVLGRRPSPPFFFFHLTHLEWLPLDPRGLVATLQPRAAVVSERNANFLTISAQRLEQEPHHIHLARAHHPHLPLLCRELDRRGPVTLRRETSATSIGILVNVTAGSSALLNIRKTPVHSLAAPTWPGGSRMEKTKKALPMLPWNFSRLTT